MTLSPDITITFSRKADLEGEFLKVNLSLRKNESVGLASSLNSRFAVLPIIFLADAES